jgi:hypothetical protein
MCVCAVYYKLTYALQELASIPFECMPTLETQTTITRMSSVHMLCRTLKSTINNIPSRITHPPQQGYYVLDPGSEFDVTRRVFEPIFKLVLNCLFGCAFFVYTLQRIKLDRININCAGA